VQSYSPYRANFRCPICGDSQKNKYKKRGYIIEADNNLMFYCHNECGSMGFEYFLKEHYGDLYSSYKFDLLRNIPIDITDNRINEVTEVVSSAQNEIKLDLASSNQLALNFLRSRKIPESFYHDIFYTDRFHQYINEILPDKFPKEVIEHKEPRIVFPMRGYDNKIFGVISRALDPKSEMRYITIKFDSESPKIFGLDRMNRDQKVYVLEGPIDSLFINNGIALAGTDGNPDEIFSNKEDYVLVLDNQPRSESVIKKYQKYIHMGCQMVIWPKYITSKDINDCILEQNITIDEINDIVKSNTYSGLKLRIMFNDWKRV